MFTATIQETDPALTTAYSQLLAKAPEIVNTLISRRANRVRDRLLAAFRRKPGSPSYPIEWQTMKQQAAFFATNGFGRGIPTKRTDRMINAWKLLVVYQPNRITEIAIFNDTPYRDFVTGRRQQRMHAATGWYDDATLIKRAQREFDDGVETDLIKGFYAVEAA